MVDVVSTARLPLVVAAAREAGDAGAELGGVHEVDPQLLVRVHQAFQVEVPTGDACALGKAAAGGASEAAALGALGLPLGPLRLHHRVPRALGAR